MKERRNEFDCAASPKSGNNDVGNVPVHKASLNIFVRLDEIICSQKQCVVAADVGQTFARITHGEHHEKDDPLFCLRCRRRLV